MVLPEGDERKDADKTELEKMAAKEPVKAYALELLAEKYGIAEDDFLSAEIEVVPAGPARELGFDRSMILGYGQDDSACAYPSLIAQLALEGTPQRTAVTVLVDKEEIGSVGNTGMQSRYFENTVLELLEKAGCTKLSDLSRTLRNSRMLSSDVSIAFDPNYPEVSDPKNSAYFGGGICFNKYTGSRGKGGSNDANPEYYAWIRKVMDEAEVNWQNAELGRVDQGGGGTIAYILGNYNMNVIDAGLPVHNMHAPMEIVSKVDVYEAYLGYKAFLQAE
jgi:aspartyl aminopeptidase